MKAINYIRKNYITYLIERVITKIELVFEILEYYFFRPGIELREEREHWAWFSECKERFV